MKKRKIFKTLAFSSLAACMFCLPVLAGCAPAEMLPQNPEPGQNFDLGLNPETDPIVYITASGLQIKKSNAKYNSTTNNQNLIGYYYFTMGTYSGYNVNWVILGRGKMPVADNTPAGSAIQGDAGKQEIAMGNSIYENLNLSAIPENTEIPGGCFLAMSECVLFKTQFRTSSGVGNYDGSNLQSEMSTLFNSGLGLTNSQKAMIVPQTLKNYYIADETQEYPKDLTYSISTENLFLPLNTNRSDSGQEITGFVIKDYLSTQELRVAYTIGTNTASDWWLRQGHTNSYTYAFRVDETGSTSMTSKTVTTACGVRPFAVISVKNN